MVNGGVAVLCWVLCECHTLGDGVECLLPVRDGISMGWGGVVCGVWCGVVCVVMPCGVPDVEHDALPVHHDGLALEVNTAVQSDGCVGDGDGDGGVMVFVP